VVKENQHALSMLTEFYD